MRPTTIVTNLSSTPRNYGWITASVKRLRGARSRAARFARIPSDTAFNYAGIPSYVNAQLYLPKRSHLVHVSQIIV